jgi:two-component system, OmpR family, KDP operon response regulator KdpE
VTRILVVDDEPQIRKALSVNLTARGYDVDTADTGEEALARAAAHLPDLVLLDIGLPGIDGIAVVEGLRGWTSVPIIMLSVRDAEEDKVRALDAGADDYVTKPFGMNEVLARLRAALRRHHPEPEQPVVTTDAFALDLAQRVARLQDGTAVHLTPTEWEIVDALVRHPGRLVTQRHLLQQVWGPQYERETNYLRVHLAAIRKKLEPEPGRPRFFVTEPGIGYRFELEPPAPSAS